MKKTYNSIFDILKMLIDENVDGISFTPDGKNGIRIDRLRLDEKVTFITHSLGHMYDVLTYKMGKGGTISDIDRFDCILSGPEVYINNLIKCGFNGLVIKKTEENNSNDYVNHIYEKLCQPTK